MTSKTGKNIKIRLIVLAILIVGSAPFVWLGWKDLWNIFLEKTPPEIKMVELPAGVGATPSVISFKVADAAAGIDEIVVRVRQRGRSVELFKAEYKRSASERITVELPSDKSVLIEGSAILEIAAFDASFWNNSTLLEFPLKVDYRKPTIRVISTQHNVRRGGSQLIIYAAKDDNLAMHGVRVGRRVFLGVPLAALDSAFQRQDNLYAALFSVGSDFNEDTSDVRLFAEDEVGNGTSARFSYRILPVNSRSEKVRLTEAYLDERINKLYKNNLANIQEFGNEVDGQELHLDDQLQGSEQLLSAFKACRGPLASWSELELQRLLKNYRLNRLWDEAFFPLAGTVVSSYGRPLVFDFNGQTILEDIQTGYELSPNRGQVLAGNTGIVAFVDNLGSFGQVVGVDHGMGLFSIYAWLSEMSVKVGDKIYSGQVLGYSGGSGLSRGQEFLYQMRLHGVSVDPREWSDKSWYFSHIVDKVNQAKSKFGLPILVGQLSAL